MTKQSRIAPFVRIVATDGKAYPITAINASPLGAGGTTGPASSPPFGVGPTFSGDAFSPRPCGSRRTRMLGFGLSAAAAIALAGCSAFSSDGWCDHEAGDINYSTVRAIARRGVEAGAKLVPDALADGVLTQCEYNEIILAKSAEEVREYAEDKRALQREFAQ